MPAGSYPWLVRTAACVPILLKLPHRFLRVGGWGLVGVLSVFAGHSVTTQRWSRECAQASARWEVAEPVVHAGAAVVRLTGWPVAARLDRWRAPARVVAWYPVPGTPSGPRVGDGLMLRGLGSPPTPGAILSGPLHLTVPPTAAIPAGFDYRAFLAGRGILWSASSDSLRPGPVDPVARLGSHFLEPMRTSLLARIDRLFPPREAALVAAVLLGRRTGQSRSAGQPFARLGLAHLFSVSGLHVGILLAIVMLPGAWFGASPGQRVLPLILLLPVYVVLTGMPGSVVRAAGLGLLGAAAAFAGRRSDTLRLVGLLFWIGSIADPVQNLDTGLRLSYCAAGGILAISGPAERSGLIGTGAGRWIGTGLLVSLSAQWFTLPWVASSFGVISSLSPGANLIAVPVFGVGLWMVVLALLTDGIWHGAGEAIAGCAWLLFRGLAGGVQGASGWSGGVLIGLEVPGPLRISILVLLTIPLWLVVSGRTLRWCATAVRRRLLVGAILGFGFLFVSPVQWGAGPEVRVWIFDVGQGDCSLVCFGDDHTVMIDTAGRYGRSTDAEGPLSRNLLPFLARHRIRRIDAVVLTHGHLDHTGGTSSLARAVEVGEYLCGGHSLRAVPEAAAGTAVEHPLAGRVIHRWREWTLEILFPPGELPRDDWSENDRSLVVALRNADHTVAVFSGDLELDGEALWERDATLPRDIEVWKAGHHGSNTSGSPELLDAMAPEVVAISCGVGNRYGHPSHGRYVARGKQLNLLRTDLDGTIRIDWNGIGDRRVYRYRGASSRGRLDTAASRF